MTKKQIEAYGEILFTNKVKKTKVNKKIFDPILIGFDTEYDPKTSDLFTYQLSYKGVPNIYYDKMSFSSILSHLRGQYNLNLSKRKTVYLISYFSSAEIQHLPFLDCKIIQYSPNNFEFLYLTKSNIKICIIDLQVFFLPARPPLKKVAETFELKKLDYDVTQLSKDKIYDNDFIEYAKIDAFICEQIFIKLRNRYLQRFKVDILKTKTTANTSSCIYRTYYMPKPPENTFTHIRRLALQANWGGNNQCFYRGCFFANEGFFYEYDAYSMYPNSAIELKAFPSHKDFFPCTTIKEFIDNKNLGGLCKVRFKFPKDCFYPCLPTFFDNKLCYPLSGISYCTLQEIRTACEMNCKIDLLKAYAYRTGDPSYCRYMDMLVKEKEKADAAGDKILRILYKLMANALVGKLMQKILDYDINDLAEASKKFEFDLSILPQKDIIKMCIANGIKLKKNISIGNLFIPEWHSLILGYSRATLAKAFYKHKALVGTTDSLIFYSKEKLGQPLIYNGIRFDLKTKGKAIILLRTRLYALFDEFDYYLKNFHMIKFASHGLRGFPNIISFFKYAYENLIHVLIDTEKIIQSEKIDREFFEYKVQRLITLREAIRYQKPFMQKEERDFKINLAWDNKRILSVFRSYPIKKINN